MLFDDAFVPLDRTGHRQADARVARRRFDDGESWLQETLLLGILHHAIADAVLHRSSRIKELAFGIYENFKMLIRLILTIYNFQL